MPAEDSLDTMDLLINNRLEALVAMTEEEYVKIMQYSDSELWNIIHYLLEPIKAKTNAQIYKLINDKLYRME